MRTVSLDGIVASLIGIMGNHKCAKIQFALMETEVDGQTIVRSLHRQSVQSCAYFFFDTDRHGAGVTGFYTRGYKLAQRGLPMLAASLQWRAVIVPPVQSLLFQSAYLPHIQRRNSLRKMEDFLTSLLSAKRAGDKLSPKRKPGSTKGPKAPGGRGPIDEDDAEEREIQQVVQLQQGGPSGAPRISGTHEVQVHRNMPTTLRERRQNILTVGDAEKDGASYVRLTPQERKERCDALLHRIANDEAEFHSAKFFNLGLGVDGALRLRHALASNHTLRKLYMTGNGLGPDGCKILSRSRDLPRRRPPRPSGAGGGAAPAQPKATHALCANTVVVCAGNAHD